MNKLQIEPTYQKPKVIFDPENGHYEISGQSIPENAMETFGPIFNWVDENLAHVNADKIEFNISLDYFNTASAKMILDLFLKLESHFQKGKNIVIKWSYDEDDIDMQAAGEDYAETMDIPFEMIPVKNEDEEFEI